MIESFEKKLFTINWTEELHLGIDEVDKQHEKLAESVNNIYQLYIKPTKENELLDEVDSLIELFKQHFNTEHDLFEKYNVSNKQEQYQEHDKILTEILEIREKRLSILVKTIFINQVLLYYLKTHLIEEDRESFNEIKAKMKLNRKAG